MKNISLDLSSLRRLYHSGVRPRDLLSEILERIEAWADPALFTYLMNEAEWEPWLRRLEAIEPDTLPLYGVPFVLSDNIDLEWIPTTAGCPGYAYIPEESSPAVQRLIRAGAFPLGKVNLDQFGLGSTGMESPYGMPRNAYMGQFVPGGAASGAASAIAAGLASFAVATDSQGGLRIPAALQGLVGLRPTQGLWSSRGMVLTHQSLESPGVVALRVADAARITAVAADFDYIDPLSRRPHPYSRPRTYRMAVPRKEQLKNWEAFPQGKAFEQALSRWKELGYGVEEVDFTPWLEASDWISRGPWSAEEGSQWAELAATNPAELLPSLREHLGSSPKDARELMKAQRRLAVLKRGLEPLWSRFDALLLPTLGRPLTPSQVRADPANVTELLAHPLRGTTLLDQATLTLPLPNPPQDFPFGLSLVGPAWSDPFLLELAAAFSGETHGLDLGILSPRGGFVIAVCGAHMRGLPLNDQLTERGAVFLESSRTSCHYQLYAFQDGELEKPGLVRISEGGSSIALELWSLPEGAWGSFIQLIPPPLGLGTLELEDGRLVKGFLMESVGAEGARNVTHTLGWRNYIQNWESHSQESAVENNL